MGTDNKLLKISFISVNFDFYNGPMEWTTAHDVLLCREIFLQEFYKFKKGSNERGRTWTQISEKSQLCNCSQIQSKSKGDEKEI